MKKLIVLLVMASLAFATADGESLRNNAGEHVVIGVEDGTQNIKWLKVTSDGYMIATVVPSVASAPDLGIANLTGTAVEASYTFGGNTALSFCIQNTSATNTLTVGIATGGPYFTIYPRSSMSIPSCAITEIFYVASGAGTTFDVVYTY